MSTHTRNRRLTVPQLVAMKGRQKIVSLTAYSSAIAKVIDPLVDFILVGDSTAMVGYGRPSTLGMRLDEIIGHTRAVVDSTRLACVIADMPFGSYQESHEQAFRNCAQVLASTGCDAVKLEANQALASTVAFLVARGIPVMAHIGLMPQFINVMGGYKAQGMSPDSGAALRADAQANLEAGAFSWCSKAWPNPLPAPSPRPPTNRPSALAPHPLAMARCWSPKTCWGWAANTCHASSSSMPTSAR